MSLKQAQRRALDRALLGRVEAGDAELAVGTLEAVREAALHDALDVISSASSSRCERMVAVMLLTQAGV